MLKSLWCTRYWRQKFVDPEFHGGLDSLCLTHHRFVDFDFFWVRDVGWPATLGLDENTRFMIHFAVYVKTLEAPQITAREVHHQSYPLLPHVSVNSWICVQMLAYLRDSLNLNQVFLLYLIVKLDASLEIYVQLEGERGRRYINRIWESWGFTSKSATHR